ncbi:MAG TPA: hypothetical protein VN366_13015 [Feifaniaceae bacterium]|nr:hypothetical protein [Feifaniaceae bacterium]
MKEQNIMPQPGAGPGTAGVREELLQIKSPGAVYHGCDQRWYQKAWQRMSGCGPTTASSLFLYSQRANRGMPQPDKAECLRLMEEMWDYITPTWQGVHTTGVFSEGAKRFADMRGLQADTAALDVPGKPDARPTPDTVIGFLQDAFGNDLPVAFLNHNNGAEKALDSHHWVAVVSLSHVPGGAAEISFLDEGIIKRIDIGNWLRTTTGGGGFATVRFF